MSDMSVINPERLVVLSDSKVEVVRRVLHSNGIIAEIRPLMSLSDGESLSEVMVSRAALSAAVSIIESEGVFQNPRKVSKTRGVRGIVLIPVDLSPLSRLACKVGFELAVRLDLHPVLLHAYVGPMFASELQFDGDISFGDMSAVDVAEAETNEDVENEVERLLRKFRRQVLQWQKDGEVENVAFSTRLASGVPEDVIDAFCRVSLPELVVMATRHRQKKQQDMVGSVTVEVLDSCRTPVFTVPEDYLFPGIADIKRLLFFCNLDRHDVDSVDNLMKMFDYPSADIFLVASDIKGNTKSAPKIEALCRYLSDMYPTAKFSFDAFSGDNFREDLEQFVKNENIQMVVVPNKKSNIFSRLFRPGIAHKILFESDIPLLALPV